MKLIIKKMISVISGYFVSLPIFYSYIYQILSPIIQATILCIFFIIYYYICDKIIKYIEIRIENNKKKEKE